LYFVGAGSDFFEFKLDYNARDTAPCVFLRFELTRGLQRRKGILDWETRAHTQTACGSPDVETKKETPLRKSGAQGWSTSVFLRFELIGAGSCSFEFEFEYVVGSGTKKGTIVLHGGLQVEPGLHALRAPGRART
jgi:hypothetical protein